VEVTVLVTLQRRGLAAVAVMFYVVAGFDLVFASSRHECSLKTVIRNS
jgi:hypothetical protein